MHSHYSPTQPKCQVGICSIREIPVQDASRAPPVAMLDAAGPAPFVAVGEQGRPQVRGAAVQNQSVVRQNGAQAVRNKEAAGVTKRGAMA